MRKLTIKTPIQIKKIGLQCCLTLFFLVLTGQITQAQNQDTIPLNQHFFPIADLKEEDQVYKSVLNKKSESQSDTKIYTLSDRLVKQIEDSYNTEEGFQQRLVYRYDSVGSLISFSLINLTELLHLTRYFEQESILAEVIKKAPNLYQISLAEGQSFEAEFDPFRPGLANPVVFNEYLYKTLNYPLGARRLGAFGTVIVAIEIDADGEYIRSEVANPAEVNQLLAREADRVIRKHPGPWRAALDLQGNPKGGWCYLPIRFVLSDETLPPLGNLDFLQN